MIAPLGLRTRTVFTTKRFTKLVLVRSYMGLYMLELSPPLLSKNLPTSIEARKVGNRKKKECDIASGNCEISRAQSRTYI